MFRSTRIRNVGPVTTTIVRLLIDHGYIAIFALMLLESACIPIPSEVTMLVGGALTEATFVHMTGAHPLNVVAVALVGTFGNLVGSWIAWAIGYRGGRPLVEHVGRYVRLDTKHLDRSEQWFAHYGAVSVFAARLLPAVRTFISLPAGMARMSFRRFTTYTIVGCLPWTFALAFIGKALGSQWTRAEHDLKPLTYVVITALLALVAWAFVRRHYRRNV